MAAGLSTAEQTGPGVLTLYLDNTRPIPVEQLSVVLSTLAKDYRRFSKGGALVVRGIELGSLRLKLAAYASAGLFAMSQANTIADFGERVAQGIERLRERPESSTGRRPGDKSALEIVKLVAESGSEFELNYSAPDGERIYLKMGAADAERIVEDVTTAQQQRLALPSPAKQLAHSQEEWMGDLVKRLAESRSGKPLTAESRTLLAIAADTLKRHGSDRAVEDFGQRLEAQGLLEEAKVVRSELRSPRPPRLIGPS